MRKIILLIFSTSMMLMLISCSNKKDSIVSSINEFSKFELGTVEYVVEKAVAADKGTYYKDYELSIGDKKILYAMTAILKAGLDLDSFNPETDVTVSGKTVSINLPAPKLLVVNIAPESIKYEFSKVSWFRFDFSEEEKDQVLKMGEQSIRDTVDEIGILKDAEQNAKNYFDTLLRNMGFSSVTINFV